MVRPENITAKLAYLRSILKKLDRLREMPTDSIFSNADLTAALERYLFLAAQAAIDSVEMFCKLKQLGRPESMGEAIRFLHSAGVIEHDFSEKMLRMVGFRNYLSHGYEHLNRTVLEEVLHKHLGDLEQLAQVLEQRC